MAATACSVRSSCNVARLNSTGSEFAARSGCSATSLVSSARASFSLAWYSSETARLLIA